MPGAPKDAPKGKWWKSSSVRKKHSWASYNAPNNMPFSFPRASNYLTICLLYTSAPTSPVYSRQPPRAVVSSESRSFSAHLKNQQKHLARPRSVSYTHLDVYKRQGFNQAMAPPTKFLIISMLSSPILVNSLALKGNGSC